MTTRFHRRSRLAAGALAVAGALLLTACGDQTDEAGGDSGGSGSVSDAPLYDLLPQDIQQAGEIVVGSDINYAPIEYYDENDEVTGLDPAIADALGDLLGVDLTFRNGTFDGLILGMNNGRYDVIMSAMTDTAERQQGASDDAGGGGADFVDYFEAGSAILVRAGNPEDIDSLDDLCGLSVAAQQGTANEQVIDDQQRHCDEPIDPVINDSDSESLTALQSGRAEAVITDYPVALYNQMERSDVFQVVGEQINAAPYGIAVPTDETKLRDALQAAVQEIMDNGTYDQILKEWDAETGALDKATINAGT